MSGAQSDYWREALVPAHAPGGTPIAKDPAVNDAMETFTVIAGGEAMCTRTRTGAAEPPGPTSRTSLFATPRSPSRWALIGRVRTHQVLP